MSDKLNSQGGTSTSDCGCGCKGAGNCGDQKVDTSRRRLAAATLSTPIMAVLMSRPVWGATLSPSGFMSGNLSGAGDEEPPGGNGCTPGFWKTHPEIWNPSPSGYDAGECKEYAGGSGKCKEWNSSSGTPFVNVFGFEPAVGVGKTLLEVMLDHEDAGNFGTYQNHVVAALLNADFAPDTYGATTDQIIEIVKMVAGLLPNPLGKTWQDAFALFVAMNEAGSCFFNAHGDCENGFVLVDNQCIPACPDGFHYDFNAFACVPDS